MEFREKYIENWEGKEIEYQGEKIYIVKQIEYKGTKYLYGILEKSIFTDDDEFEVCFLYRKKEDIFADVRDEQLYRELLSITAGTFVADEIKKMIKNKS